MARDYARIMTSIWRNAEFRSLTEQQQRAYLFLVTQPDISAAGVLPLRCRRWADAAATSSPDSLAQLLKELENGRFIVVDWDAEELLIRSFIRWDGGFNNPKRRPVIIRAAEEVQSGLITRHLMTEFARCGIKPLPDGPSGGGQTPPDTQDDSLSGTPSKIDRVELGDEPFPQVNSLSDSAPTNRGVVVTLVGKNTTTHNPQPVPPTAAAAAAPEPAAVIDGHETNAGDVVAEWAESFDATGNKPTGRQRGQVGKEARDLLEAGNDPQRILAAARALGAKGRSTLVAELAIQSQPQRAAATYRPAAMGWQDLKQPAGADGRSALFAISGGESA